MLESASALFCICSLGSTATWGAGYEMRMVWPAALVHLFTALGAVCALMATRAVLAGAWEQMFAWLGLALIIDGIDGTFARMADVSAKLAPFFRRAARPGHRLCDLCVRAGAGIVAGWLLGGPACGVMLASLILLVLAVSFFRHREQERGPLLRRLSRHLEHRCVLCFRLSACPSGRRPCSSWSALCSRSCPMRWAHPLRTPLLWPVTLAADGRCGSWPHRSRSGRVFPPGPSAKAILLLAAGYGVGLALLRSQARE